MGFAGTAVRSIAAAAFVFSALAIALHFVNFSAREVAPPGEDGDVGFRGETGSAGKNGIYPVTSWTTQQIAVLGKINVTGTPTVKMTQYVAYPTYAQVTLEVSVQFIQVGLLSFDKDQLRTPTPIIGDSGDFSLLAFTGEVDFVGIYADESFVYILIENDGAFGGTVGITFFTPLSPPVSG